MHILNTQKANKEIIKTRLGPWTFPVAVGKARALPG
jgi:hypothetical protein